MRKLSAFAVALLALCGSAAADFTVRQDAEFPRWKSGQVYYSEYDGCSGGLSTAGSDNWASSASGTAAGLVGAAITDAGDPCEVGVVLGTVATNDSGVRQSAAAYDIGNGEVCFTAWIRELVISDDATADFIVRVGFSEVDVAPTRFVGFRYNDDTAATTDWQAVARFGSVETGTVFDTDIVYLPGGAATSRWLKTCINAAGTSATFYHSTTSPYNMTLVTTLSSNIPTNTIGPGVVVERTIGIAASTPMNIKFLAVEFKPTTPRW